MIFLYDFAKIQKTKKIHFITQNAILQGFTICDIRLVLCRWVTYLLLDEMNLVQVGNGGFSSLRVGVQTVRYDGLVDRMFRKIRERLEGHLVDHGSIVVQKPLEQLGEQTENSNLLSKGKDLQ